MSGRATAESIVDFQNVSFSYHYIPVLSQFSYRFQKHTNTVLFGGNGAGKSTLLNLIAGIISPTEGKVTRHFYENPSIVLQSNLDNVLLPITVEECVSMGRWEKQGRFRKKTDHDGQLIEKAIAALGLETIRKKQLSEISGGQRQRALLAQMLTQDSELVLLDEPATGLDLEANRFIAEVIQNLLEENVSVIQATHSLEVAREADEVILLRQGKILTAGSPQTVLTEENLIKLF